MKAVDLFSGLEGWATPFRDRGYPVVSVDIDPSFEPDIVADIFELDAETIRDALGGSPDVVLAGPPCDKFSCLNIGKHWTGARDDPPHAPKTEGAAQAWALVERTLELIYELEPVIWVMENPRAKLRRLIEKHRPGLERRTVTYCQYGGLFQKPTDLWGRFPASLELLPPCKAGQACHISAPRGSSSGIQGDLAAVTHGLGDAYARAVNSDRNLTANKALARKVYGTSSGRLLAALKAKIPIRLAEDVCLAAERDLGLAI